jgi:hypothetical protein
MSYENFKELIDPLVQNTLIWLNKEHNINISHQELINIMSNDNKKPKGKAKSNENGLPYEQLTDLKTHYNIIDTKNEINTIVFNSTTKKFRTSKKTNLFKCIPEHLNTIDKGHGCKQPDEYYIDDENKVIFFIEKKFQEVNGSTCEKVQTIDFKIWQYSRTFPTYKIVYIYCLSEWFKHNCKAELQYLKYKNVEVFWGYENDCKEKMINFITNYK